jgi:hypothetical protein
MVMQVNVWHASMYANDARAKARFLLCSELFIQVVKVNVAPSITALWLWSSIQRNHHMLCRICFLIHFSTALTSATTILDLLFPRYYKAHVDFIQRLFHKQFNPFQAQTCFIIFTLPLLPVNISFPSADWDICQSEIRGVNFSEVFKTCHYTMCFVSYTSRILSAKHPHTST